MKLPPFEYRSPETVDEVVALLAEYGDEAKVLAGGQSLLPLLAMRLGRPAVLIDINRLRDLSGISANGVLRVGALTRHRTGERSPVSRAALPMLGAALAFVGHDAIRTRGTIGGSIAHGDPAAEMPTVARTLDATLHVTNAQGTREIDAESFFHGFLMTSLEPDDLLTAIEYPIPGDRCGWSFNEVSRRSGDFALVGCAVMVELGSDGTVVDARIGLSGVADVPFRAGEAEALLRGSIPDAALFDLAADAAGVEVSPTTDLHGTVEYRRHLTRGLVRNGLRQAVERANGVS